MEWYTSITHNDSTPTITSFPYLPSARDARHSPAKHGQTKRLCLCHQHRHHSDANKHVHQSCPYITHSWGDTAALASRQCTTTHISHPIMTLKMTQLHSLNRLIQASLDQTLSHRGLFRHLRITAMSTLIPSNRTLKITLDNDIHILTPPRTRSVTISHHLRLYLNPHNRPTYLQHTYTRNEPPSYSLIVTTSLLSQRSRSSSARRRPMLRTTVHAPDIVTNLTFPADSIQYQQSILTLTIHLLLTVPIITRQQSWKIIRERESHRHTLQLILVTITLKRYDLVWYTVINESPATQPIHQIPTKNLSNRPKRRTILNPRQRPPKQRRHIWS